MAATHVLILAALATLALAQVTDLPAGQKVYFSSPQYPNKYAPGSSLKRLFTTSTGGILNVVCVFQIPSTDRIMFNLRAASFTFVTQSYNGGPTRREFNSTSNGLAVGYMSTAGSVGGFINCVVTALGSTPIAEPPMNTTCGVTASLSNRVVNGAVVPEYEIPWQVRLEIIDTAGESNLCGGSVIAPEWIITAAHCTIKAAIVTVIAGQYNINMPTLEQQTIEVSSIINHEEYSGIRYFNDIALLKLKTPLKYSNAVRPVCLPYSIQTKVFNGEVGTSSGFGKTSYTGDNSDVLLKISVPIFGIEACRKFPFLKFTTVTDNQICAYRQGVDTCQGDSGGPLTWVDPSNGRTYLMGAVSFGFAPCATTNAPTIYTNVARYLTWIETKTGATFSKI